MLKKNSIIIVIIGEVPRSQAGGQYPVGTRLALVDLGALGEIRGAQIIVIVLLEGRHIAAKIGGQTVHYAVEQIDFILVSKIFLLKYNF